ncbi:MAG: hypothetical protein HY902_16770 [Deltaproteobacteria bacterium]|nr:hypothetical protein [Deltaproteobacteria bacterium]
MSTPASPWPWVGRALATAALLVVLGWAVGVLGALTQPWLAILLGAVGIFLGGGAWAASRLGSAGVAAAFIGFIAAHAMALEGRHAVVARSAAVVELAGLSAWEPRGGAVALHVGELKHLFAQQTWYSKRTGTGKTASSVSLAVTPLYDPAEQRVVGFHCASPREPRRGDGRWVLATAEWQAGATGGCSAGVQVAAAKCAQAKLAVAEGSERRLVEVFASEAELRGAHRLDQAVGIPLGFLVFYAALVVIFRRKGAAR